MTDELGPCSVIRNRKETLYALLVSTGYLKVAGAFIGNLCPVAIPNHEVEQVFVNDIVSRIRKRDPRSVSDALMIAIARHQPEVFAEAMRTFLLETVSFFDTATEGFYHGMLLGFLAELRGFYRVLSNRESGYGRFDVALEPLVDDFPGVVIEVKAADSDSADLTALAVAARAQIDEKAYAADMAAKGIENVLKFGLAFRGKRIELKA